MSNMNVSVPDGLLKELKKHSYIKWSEVVRLAFQERINAFDKIELLKDYDKIDENIKKGNYVTHKQLKKELGLD